MSFDVERHDLVVITIDQVDRSSAVAFAAELNAAVQRYREAILREDTGPPAPLVVDFSAVRFFDSSGIRVLVDADIALGLDGGRIHVVDATGIVRRVLEVTGLWDRLTQFEADVSDTP